MLFYARKPDELSRIIVNIEAQKDKPKSYKVAMRGQYYTAREISSQLGRDFSGDDYNSMLKVYSIWICMNSDENSISRIQSSLSNEIGNFEWLDMYDLSHTIIIQLKNELDPDRDHALHRLLGALFTTGLTAKEREDILEKEFQIPMSEMKEVAKMCNLGLGIWEQGVAAGEERGEERGIAIGEERGIIQSVKRLLDHGISDNMIMTLLEVTPEQIIEAKKL